MWEQKKFEACWFTPLKPHSEAPPLGSKEQAAARVQVLEQEPGGEFISATS